MITYDKTHTKLGYVSIQEFHYNIIIPINETRTCVNHHTDV